MLRTILLTGLAIAPIPALAAEVELGPRPYYLIDQMQDGPLKQRLESCKDMTMKPHPFSIPRESLSSQPATTGRGRSSHHRTRFSR